MQRCVYGSFGSWDAVSETWEPLILGSKTLFRYSSYCKCKRDEYADVITTRMGRTRQYSYEKEVL